MIDLLIIKNIFFPQYILDFLNKSIFGVFDIWTIYHFIIVGIIYFFLRKKIKKYPATILTIVLILANEILEQMLVHQNLIRAESVINIITDILVGLLAIIVINRKCNNFKN